MTELQASLAHFRCVDSSIEEPGRQRLRPHVCTGTPAAHAAACFQTDQPASTVLPAMLPLVSDLLESCPLC